MNEIEQCIGSVIWFKKLGQNTEIAFFKKLEKKYITTTIKVHS